MNSAIEDEKMTSTTTTIRKSYGNRRLFAFPEDYPIRLSKQKSGVSLPKKNEEVSKLIKYIDDNIVGKNNAFMGPFGRRKGKSCPKIMICATGHPVLRFQSQNCYSDMRKIH